MTAVAAALLATLSQVPAEPVSPPAPAAPTLAAAAPQPPAPMVASTAPAWLERMEISGFARVGVFYTLPLGDEDLLGGRGGFRLADFRLNHAFRINEKLSTSASVEFAAPRVTAEDPLAGYRAVELRDGYVDYRAHRAIGLRVGQFRPPYYAEMLLSDGSIPFTGRSVIASGLAPPEGYGPREGLAPERQVGLQASSERLAFGESFGARYAVGVFNGNGQNALFNDNNALATFGRVELDWTQRVTLGINGYQNTRALGTRPNRIYGSELGYGADVAVSAGGLQALVGFLGRDVTYSDALPADRAWGVLAQARYVHEATGLEGAVRGAVLEPSSGQQADQVTEVTAMAGYRLAKGTRLLVQYRLHAEEKATTVANDSVDAMLHVTW
ncbi:MAG: hypothetical protein FJ086_18095 [Deltaproteobacteria bacterium]|nr:hypothetical protein [Deltaproteobacteria bacterium]